jgi:hypothetical protein
MLKTIMLLLAVAALGAAPVLGGVVSKDGSTVPDRPAAPGDPAEPRDVDWEWSTCGMDFVPTTGGSSDGWGEWFITTALNDSGEDIFLLEFGFPCCGPPTEEYGWVVWVGLGGIMPPAGDAYTADYYGPFTPVDPDPSTFPPTTYTYVDVEAEAILIPAGTYFCFGYDNTGTGGQDSYNGVETWAWYEGGWDPDVNWSRTATMQVTASFEGPVATAAATWSGIKAMYR